MKGEKGCAVTRWLLMSADTDVRGRVGLLQPLTIRFHTWKCDGWTLDGHYPRTLQPARVDCVFQWVAEEDRRPSAPWYSPLLHGSSGSCSSPPSHPGTVSVPVSRMVGWPTPVKPERGVNSITHTAHVHDIVFTLFTGFVDP